MLPRKSILVTEKSGILHSTE